MRTTLLLGLVLSVLAVAVAIVLDLAVQVAPALVVVPVFVVGFVLSWHASSPDRTTVRRPW